MFNLFKRKRTDKEVIAYLREITLGFRDGLISSFQTYIDKFDPNEDPAKIKKTILFCYSLMMVSSEFLVCSKRNNKADLIDDLTLLMLKELIRYQDSSDQESLRESILKYQDFYLHANKSFLQQLSNSHPEANEFINSFCRIAFPTENEIWKMILTRTIAIHIQSLKECIDEEMG
jgi:hypothetical protein